MAGRAVILAICILVASCLYAEAARPSGNCGLSCYRWRKCKSKLSTLTNTGGEHRPGQSGTTGQLFFSTCGDPPKSCPCKYEEPTPKPAIQLPKFPKSMMEYVNEEAKLWLQNLVDVYEEEERRRRRRR